MGGELFTGPGPCGACPDFVPLYVPDGDGFVRARSSKGAFGACKGLGTILLTRDDEWHDCCGPREIPSAGPDTDWMWD